MFYKNYWLNYHGPNTEHVSIGIMNQDMTGLEDIELEELLKHFTGFCFEVETYKYENCRKYLGNNGLFIDRIAPEIIEQSIADWHQMQKEFWKESERTQREIELYGFKEPLPDEIFTSFKHTKEGIEGLLEMINHVESKVYNKYLKEEIQKKHKELLGKYFPEL